MAKKPLSELSSDELYRLAQKREEQEELAAKEAVRAQLDELRKKRREITARHRKELAAIDAEIRNMGGRTARGRRRGSGDGSVTENVLEIVSKAKKISKPVIPSTLTANNAKPISNMAA